MPGHNFSLPFPASQPADGSDYSLGYKFELLVDVKIKFATHR